MLWKRRGIGNAEEMPGGTTQFTHVSIFCVAKGWFYLKSTWKYWPIGFQLNLFLSPWEQVTCSSNIFCSFTLISLKTWQNINTSWQLQNTHKPLELKKKKRTKIKKGGGGGKWHNKHQGGLLTACSSKESVTTAHSRTGRPNTSSKNKITAPRSLTQTRHSGNSHWI